MDLWVEEFVTDLGDNIRQLLFRDIGMVCVTAYTKVKSIVVHRDSFNEALQTHILHVLPHGLLKFHPAELFHKVRDQRNRLDHLFPFPVHINFLGGQHKELLMADCE